MKLVVETDPGVIELNWMWLPTWLGHNAEFKKEVELHILEWVKSQGMVTTSSEDLERMSNEVLHFILMKFPEPRGLDLFLKALRHVDDRGQEY